MRTYSIVPSWVLAALTLSSALLLAAIGGALWNVHMVLSLLCLVVSVLDGLYGAMAIISIFGDDEE